MNELATALAILLLGGIVGGGVFLLARGLKIEKQRRAELRAKEIEQAQLMIEEMEGADGDLARLPDLGHEVEGLILSPGERCFALCKAVQHVVQAHRTTYVGGSHGVSFRIAKGVRYRVSAYRGHPVQTEYEKVQDTGSVYVTTQRVVFAGTREVTSIVGKKVADIRIEGDHIWILAENRKTPLGLKMSEAFAPVIAYATRLLAETAHSIKQ